MRVSGPDLGSWVACSGCVLVLDRVWTLLFTETTSERCPGRREESRREHPQRQRLSPSPSRNKEPVPGALTTRRSNVKMTFH